MKYTPEFKKGGAIHIKPENKGKFTATKKKTGKSTEELTHSKNPVTRKRAIFAQNSKRWKHEDGGKLDPKKTNLIKEVTVEGGEFPSREKLIKKYGDKDTPPLSKKDGVNKEAAAAWKRRLDYEKSKKSILNQKNGGKTDFIAKLGSKEVEVKPTTKPKLIPKKKQQGGVADKMADTPVAAKNGTKVNKHRIGGNLTFNIDNILNQWKKQK